MNAQTGHASATYPRPEHTRGLTLAEAIGKFAAEAKFEDLPAEAVEKIKICLYFNLGIALAGYPQVRAAVDAASIFERTGPDSARTFVEGKRLSPPDAAFANTVMMHARAQDDFEHSANVHVGAIAIPALLALCDWRQFDGKKFLTAIAVAYQVATVLGEEHTAITTPRGFRASCMYAAPAAAAACASLIGLDARRATNAVSLGAHFAAGLGQCWIAGTDEWRTQLGHASRNAVNVTLLAEAGNSSAANVFEGKYGFYPAHGGHQPDVDRMVGKLYGPWRTETVAFKPLPVCGINQGPARNAMDAARSGRADAERIEKIEIVLPPEDVAYPGIADTGPIRSPGSALMRSAYVVSNCLHTGQLRYRDLLFRDNEKILSLADRTTVVVGNLTPMSHILNITYRDGSTDMIPYEATGREFILDRDEIGDMFASIADELAMPAETVTRVMRVVWGLDGTAIPTDIVDILSGTA